MSRFFSDQDTVHLFNRLEATEKEHLKLKIVLAEYIKWHATNKELIKDIPVTKEPVLEKYHLLLALDICDQNGG